MSNRPDWFQKADREHRRRLVGLWMEYSPEDRNFLALSLCGEVGELANKIKKHWDGRLDPPSHREIAEEIADVRILLELLAHSMTIDVEEAVSEKLDVLSRRPVNGNKRLNCIGR
jgi:NTP pyrophosphatase (non-canonical NTP hydrolase)